MFQVRGTKNRYIQLSNVDRIYRIDMVRRKIGGLQPKKNRKKKQKKTVPNLKFAVAFGFFRVFIRYFSVFFDIFRFFVVLFRFFSV